MNNLSCHVIKHYDRWAWCCKTAEGHIVVCSTCKTKLAAQFAALWFKAKTERRGS